MLLHLASTSTLFLPGWPRSCSPFFLFGLSDFLRLLSAGLIMYIRRLLSHKERHARASDPDSKHPVIFPLTLAVAGHDLALSYIYL